MFININKNSFEKEEFTYYYACVVYFLFYGVLLIFEIFIKRDEILNTKRQMMNS
ncbi:hypothetical protein FNW21_00225 [Flavobacterium restrictum]|uniref:Uncharacterized protein n=1 Tax=Flavobacterium restrictum TaxID=2594428 RepID=A0A553EDS4_9FLAO|nr:hypothetical protein FNW21_00225 [Flavobacterium restrictum]